ncbi:MAG TPA: hypothetical protein VFF68_09540 [Anaerolineaceae bacterium]|nr:hypothetical protein [Anaerolineaceae bacterium]
MNHYRIHLLGQIDLDELNTTSPHRMTRVQTTAETTLVSVCTDQSGLIGLMRHLHNRGLVLVSLQSEPETTLEKPA